MGEIRLPMLANEILCHLPNLRSVNEKKVKHFKKKFFYFKVEALI